MEADNNAILTEIRDLLKEQTELLRNSAEVSKKHIEEAEEITNRSVELQELSIARSRSNWKLYRIIVVIALLILGCILLLTATQAGY